ncbi:MAG: hypothetical protein JST68_19325 [Bacteroidetes bacterium]|nr:hypothetical protein [Bacteroidota bacterium]
MRKKTKWWLVIAIPVAYALLSRLFFGAGNIAGLLPAVMSISFLAGVPFVVGYLTVMISDPVKARKTRYCIFMPWLPLFAFMTVTLIFRIEGAACWIMIMPLWMIASSIGGLVAGKKRRKQSDDSQKLQGSWVLFLPIVCAPVEKLLPLLPARYEAYTYSDIQAPAERIWSNVVRVRTIAPEEDHGGLTKWMGFPRPIRAELDYTGVGGRRQAIFSKGLVFEEIVNDYAEQERMRFSINADPSKVPPTAMDEHIVIGGAYFDVLDGTYRLERLGSGVYRLHLYSHWVLKTPLNFYASWWAGWIMKDIQNNILQVIQTRCERNL